MTTLLAGALLSLVQGPYSPAPANQPPENAPVWIAGQEVKEHSFTVTAAFECPPDSVGGLVQVSISDTTVRAEFSADENIRRRVFSLQVPTGQLQGLRPKLFCPAPDQNPGPVLRLESKFTAQGALVCRSATGGRTTAQASLALDAWVRCAPIAEDPPAAGSEDIPSAGDPVVRPGPRSRGTDARKAIPKAAFRPAGSSGAYRRRYLR